tara:strand:+ start:1045 stop:1569 length:525 start_codon:yes stop_codon:yes gene_type:complete
MTDYLKPAKKIGQAMFGKDVVRDIDSTSQALSQYLIRLDTDSLMLDMFPDEVEGSTERQKSRWADRKGGRLKDALRHYYGMLHAKSKHGIAPSLGAGLFHEAENYFKGAKVDDIWPDLFNNIVGSFGTDEETRVIKRVMDNERVDDQDFVKMLQLAKDKIVEPPTYGGKVDRYK